MNKTSPVQIGTGTWARVAAGESHTVAIKTDGTLWAWGYNNYYQLGDGTWVDKSSPVQIGTDANWAQVAAGNRQTIAIKADGTLWAWGNNGYGQLGDWTTANKTSPVKIGTDTNWAQVAAGYNHTGAIKTDGTLWGWGWNNYGQLGDGTTANKSSPVKIGTDTNWAQVAAGGSHTVAIKTDGTLWAWGSNDQGQLGDGTTANKSSPVKIGTDTNWAQVSAVGSHTVAIKTDGTLWAWGSNGFGQLGDGTTANKSSPVKIGTDTNWAMVAAGGIHTIAKKTDGTLWAWGYNYNGQLGDGTAWKETPILIIDPAPPTGTLSINSGAAYAISNAVTLDLTCSDASGCAEIQFSNDGTNYSAPISNAATASWTLTSGDGEKTVYAKFKDGAGNWSVAYSDTIILDTTLPTGSIVVNTSEYTNSLFATLNLSASDTNGVTEMILSSDGVFDSEVAEAYATTKSWTLTSGEGLKTVYIKFKDPSGNWSNVYSDTITLDSTKPTGTISINSGATYTISTSVTLTLSASDNYCMADMQFSNNGVDWSGAETGHRRHGRCFRGTAQRPSMRNTRTVRATGLML